MFGIMHSKIKKRIIYDYQDVYMHPPKTEWIVTYKDNQISFDNFIDAFIYWIKHLLKELI